MLERRKAVVQYPRTWGSVVASLVSSASGSSGGPSSSIAALTQHEGGSSPRKLGHRLAALATSRRSAGMPWAASARSGSASHPVLALGEPGHAALNEQILARLVLELAPERPRAASHRRVVGVGAVCAALEPCLAALETYASWGQAEGVRMQGYCAQPFEKYAPGGQRESDVPPISFPSSGTRAGRPAHASSAASCRAGSCGT